MIYLKFNKYAFLNAEAKGKPPDEVMQIREKMRPHFEAMKSRAEEDLLSGKYPEKGKYHIAMNYFLENYQELVYFIDHADVAIDNNAQERLLRSHVVGRKTWYGTHSEKGAETAAIHFTIIETCKLNNVNPRDYLKDLVRDLQNGKSPYTVPFLTSWLGSKWAHFTAINRRVVGESPCCCILAKGVLFL